MIRLYGTSRVNGRYYVSGCVVKSDGSKQDFDLLELTYDQMLDRLTDQRKIIDAVHPRKGEK